MDKPQRAGRARRGASEADEAVVPAAFGLRLLVPASYRQCRGGWRISVNERPTGEAAMLSRVATILCVIISVAACSKKSEPTATDTKPSTAPVEADAITTEEGPVKAGGNYGAFRATNSTALKLSDGTTLTATPEGSVVAFMINNGTGGSLRCQCDSSCTGDRKSVVYVRRVNHGH